MAGWVVSCLVLDHRSPFIVSTEYMILHRSLESREEQDKTEPFEQDWHWW